ncbi:MAG: hypothetical protein K6F50_03610 [Kiritimatiellae bacterium]|nr:hypothetical protein [Kiritimatiellia bacterium]
MTVVFQGERVDTDDATVGEFLAGRGISVSGCMIEYKGEILSADVALSVPLEAGAALDAYRICAGG